MEHVARRLEVARTLQTLSRAATALRRAHAVHDLTKLAKLLVRETERAGTLANSLPMLDTDQQEEAACVQADIARALAQARRVLAGQGAYL